MMIVRMTLLVGMRDVLTHALIRIHVDKTLSALQKITRRSVNAQLATPEVRSLAVYLVSILSFG